MRISTKSSVLHVLALGILLWPALAALAASPQQEIEQSDDPVLLQRLGILYIQENQPREALRALERAADLMPENGETHMWLGFAYFLNNEFDQAEESYLRALSHNPDLTDVHNYMGLLYAEQDEVQRAINAFEIALEDPAYPPVSRMRVLYNLGKVYYESEDYDTALEYMQRAVELATSPQEPVYRLVYLTLGKTLRKLGLTQEAVVALERVLDADDQYVEAHLEIGLAYRDQNDTVPAREHLSRVIQLAPGSPFSERARAALAQLPG